LILSTNWTFWWTVSSSDSSELSPPFSISECWLILSEIHSVLSHFSGVHCLDFAQFQLFFYKLSIYDVTTLISSICQRINVSSHNVLTLLKQTHLLGDEQYHRPTLPNYLRLFQYLNLDWYYRFCRHCLFFWRPLYMKICLSNSVNNSNHWLKKMNP
jgi:hypothetical protein